MWFCTFIVKPCGGNIKSRILTWNKFVTLTLEESPRKKSEKNPVKKHIKAVKIYKYLEVSNKDFVWNVPWTSSVESLPTVFRLVSPKKV